MGQTVPATRDALPDGPITAVVTAFQGPLVRVRVSPDAQWVTPTIGMKLPEGAEIQTGLKSLLQFKITDDQTVTVDRLGTVQLLRANIEDGKLVTEVGMKYGRTQYDIEAAGREHDAKVRSPSSVLAVRGTRFVSEDTPPFPSRAISFEGRVMVRDARRQVSVGSRGGGKAVIRADKDSAADTALADAASPRNTAGAKSQNENQLGITLQNFLTQPELQVGVFEVIAAAQASATLNSLSVVGVVQIVQPSFTLSSLSGSPNANVNLIVTSPLGDVVTIANDFLNPTTSGGVYAFDVPSDQTGANGADQVVWVQNAPPGVYTVQQVLVNGTNVNTSLDIIDNNNPPPGTVAQSFGPFLNTLTTQNPTATTTIQLPPQSNRRRR